MAQDSSQSQDEQELQFKKRARRRLVGSIALVVLMIIILPMILEDRTAQAPKTPLNVSMAVQPSEQIESSIEPFAPDTLASDNSHSQDTEVPSTLSEPVQGTTPEETQQQLSAIKNVPAINNDLANPVSPNTKTASPIKTVSDASKKEAVNQDVNKKIAAQYFIKIGVFSDLNNVKRIQAKLSLAGLESYTESIDVPNGKSTRLLVGDYQTKSEAEDKLSKIKSLGYADAMIGRRQ